MGETASQLTGAKSTMTGIFYRLVQKELARRKCAERDRRVGHV
jgi:DNA-binding MarR family transcriptional regulator